MKTLLCISLFLFYSSLFVAGQSQTSTSPNTIPNDYKNNVRCATTANLTTIAGGLNDGDLIDGVTLVAGDRVLVKDQTTTSQNGIYTAGPTPARASDFNVWGEIPGSVVSATEGTVNGTAGSATPTIFVCTAANTGTIDVTAITFAEVSGGGGGGGTATAYGSIYWSATAATANASGVSIKVAGTTAALGSASEVTQATTNRLTYTGTADKVFYVVASMSFTASAATTTTVYLAKDGAPMTGTNNTKIFPATGPENMTVGAVVTLSTNQYLEVWCATNDGDDLTATVGTLTAFTIEGDGSGGGGGSGTPGGSTTQVQYNDAGAFGGESSFTYTKATNTATVENLTVTGTQTVATMNATTLNATTFAPSNITLPENGSVALDPAGSATGKYSGITVAGTAGTALVFGDLIVLDTTDSKWELADADSAAAADGDARGMIGICVLAAADNAATVVLLQGIVRADAIFPTITVNANVFVSSTAGDITATSPVTEDAVVRFLGTAMTTEEIYFDPDRTFITYDAP